MNPIPANPLQSALWIAIVFVVLMAAQRKVTFINKAIDTVAGLIPSFGGTV